MRRHTMVTAARPSTAGMIAPRFVVKSDTTVPSAAVSSAVMSSAAVKNWGMQPACFSPETRPSTTAKPCLSAKHPPRPCGSARGLVDLRANAAPHHGDGGQAEHGRDDRAEVRGEVRDNRRQSRAKLRGCLLYT